MANKAPESVSQKTHIVIHPVRHNGKYHDRSSLIALSGEDAKRLEESGSIKRIVTQSEEVEAGVQG